MRVSAMTRRMHHTLVLATMFLSAAAMLTACGSGPDHNAARPAAPAPTTTAPTQPTTAPPTPEPTGKPAASAEPTGKPADAAAAADGCPVSAATLLPLVNHIDNFVPTVALSNLDCYRGWATARQQVAKEYDGKAQPVTFLFRYERSSQRWTYSAAGTSEICPASMPAAIQKHFAICAT
jgi:hypothetical protein